MIDTMHLFVTNKCTNNCPLCCNKNYDIEKIPLPTEEELGSIRNVFLTGGEPFLLGKKLNKIVNALRSRENIKNIYIYTSGYECYKYFTDFEKLPNINGINLLYYSNLGIEYPYKVYENVNEILKIIENERLE